MKILAPILLWLSMVATCAAQGYTMGDLEALEKERSYSEFFSHALDIRPSERTEYWKTMVQNMGESYLKLLLQKNRLEEADFKEAERLMGWSVLAGYEFFRLKRQELAVRWFTQCFKENSGADSVCWQNFTSFWEIDRQEPDLAPRLLTLLSPYLTTSGEAQNPAHRARLLVTPYFILKPLLKSPLAQLQCKKPELQEVLWQELKKEWELNIKQRSFTSFLKDLAHETCWPELANLAHSFWSTGAAASDLNLSYLLLKSQGALKEQESDLFYISYLLGSPSRGETFNLAWARIQALRREPQRREELMRILKQWSALPGDLFNDLDLVKRRVTARHVQQNFPEYFDHYAHVCVDFFGGRKRFPEGSPALYCRELFSLADEEKNLLPDALIQTFKASL